MGSVYSVGHAGSPEVLTVGGDGDDVIYGVNTRTNSSVKGQQGDGNVKDLIIANGGDDVIIARGGSNEIIAGSGADTIHVTSDAQATVIFGDNVRNSGEGDGHLKSSVNKNSAGERVNEADTVVLDHNRADVKVYQVGLDKWIAEHNASGEPDELFDMHAEPNNLFNEGALTASFDLKNDTVVEMHDIETLKFRDMETGVEIGSKGKLRIALDYHKDNPIIQLSEDRTEFKIITPARTIFQEKPDFFTLTENTTSGVGRREKIIKLQGTEIDADPYFSETDPIVETAVEQPDGSWLVDGLHKTNLTYKSVETNIEQQDFEVIIEGGDTDPEGNPVPETMFQLSAYDRIEWIGTEAGSITSITRIIDLNETKIGELGGDKLTYGSDEQGVYFDNGLDNKTYITGVDAEEDKATNGVEIVGDIIIGTDQGEVIIGGFGDDIIIGNAGDDTLIGSAGDDVLIGGIGDDILLDVDDFAIQRLEEYSVDGQSERDLAQVEEDLALLTGPSDDVLIGGQGYDSIDGNGGRDFISTGEVSATTLEDVQLANTEDSVSAEVFERVFVYEDETMPEPEMVT
ncbi:hypothetical protein N8146_01065 [Ascidiaceihabitans sp.]|nr:hypothetical protein [Ascidiaceihabitans sp.]